MTGCIRRLKYVQVKKLRQQQLEDRANARGQKLLKEVMERGRKRAIEEKARQDAAIIAAAERARLRDEMAERQRQKERFLRECGNRPATSIEAAAQRQRINSKLKHKYRHEKNVQGTPQGTHKVTYKGDSAHIGDNNFQVNRFVR